MSDGEPKTRNWLVPYQFKPGNPGGPGAGKEKRAFRRASAECLARIADAFFHGGTDELKKLTQEPDFTPVEKLCVSVMLKAVEKGDAGALNLILDRFIGKITQPVEVKPAPADGIDYTTLSDEELMKRRALLQKVNK